MRLARATLSASLFTLALASGQPRFEAASIHPGIAPNGLDAPQAGLRYGVRINGARAEFGRYSLTNLICTAYRVRTFQIVGPDWLASAAFDIVAKLPDGASADQVPEMLRALMAERFKLALHRDVREFSLYVLAVGKDGPKLQVRPKDYDPAAPTSLVRAHTMDDLAAFLSGGMGRPVVDQTALAGEYMLNYEDVAGDFLRRIVFDHPDTGGSRITERAAQYTGRDVFHILEGWGLKLEPRKLPQPVLVIDHVEKIPTDN